MAIKVPQKNGKFKYKCSFCNKVYDDPERADWCRDTNHDLVYVQILREDVNRLIEFIYLKNDKLITETMVKSLKDSLKME